ncbi:MAG TPA: radical SAM protein, partial [Polyangiaceae bacterium]|nr:radical SAM protein [Polyangiaceae bacterium]
MDDASRTTVVDRMRGQGARVHVPIGGECNNHCLFCMEADRASRARAAKRMTAARVRELLAAQRGVEEVCFTSGEPTMRPELGLLVRWARESGCARVSLMTNGRRLAYAP